MCVTPRRVAGILSLPQDAAQVNQANKSHENSVPASGYEVVVALSLGMSHAAALTSRGRLYTWGSGWHGKLGHGDIDNRWSPSPVFFFKNTIVTMVAVSTYHSMAVDDKGNVYSWGRGDKRLGLGYIDHDILVPTRNDDLWAQRIVPVCISAAESHNVIATTTGEVYAWGEGQYGKLGIATRSDVKAMADAAGAEDVANQKDGARSSSTSKQKHQEAHNASQVPEISSANPATVRDEDGEPLQLGGSESISSLDIRAVSCYSNHSVALSATGTLYSWGNGGSGRLGSGSNLPQANARVIDSIVQTRYANPGGGGVEQGSMHKRKNGDDDDLDDDGGRSDMAAGGGVGGGGGGGMEGNDGPGPGGGAAGYEGSLRDLIQRVETYKQTGGYVCPTVKKLSELMFAEPSGCSLVNLQSNFGSMDSDNKNLDALMRRAQRREKVVTGIDNQIQTAVTSTVLLKYPKSEGIGSQLEKDANDHQRELKSKKITALALEDMEERRQLKRDTKAAAAAIKDKARGKETKESSRTQRKKMAAALARANLNERKTLPRSISSRLGSYVQVFGMCRAHPCYLFELYQNLFYGNEASGLAARAPYVKFAARRFFSLVTTIYCDIGHDSTHQNLFLLFTKRVIVAELSELYDESHGDFEAFQASALMDASDGKSSNDSASVAMRCVRHYFTRSKEMIPCMRRILSGPTTQLALVTRSLTCDPLAISRERGGGRGRNRTKSMTAKELKKQRNALYGRLDIKNEVNERKGRTAEMSKEFVNASRKLIRTMPYGGAWLIKSIFNYCVLLFGKTDTTTPKSNSGGDGSGNGNGNTGQQGGETKNGIEDTEERLFRLRFLMARIVVTSCVLPGLRKWRELGLVSAKTTPSRKFSTNLSWLRGVLPEIVSNDPKMGEYEWSKLIVMLKNRSAIQTENAMAQLLAGNDLGDIQYRLVLDLYRERLRKKELVMTVDLGNFQYMRWLLTVAARGSLFESPAFHRATKFDRDAMLLGNGAQNAAKTNTGHGAASSEAQGRMSESIFGPQGILGASKDVRESIEFERKRGITEFETSTSKSTPIAANLSIQTRWIPNVGGERKAKSCENCRCILAPALAVEGTQSIAIQGPDEALSSSLSGGKMAIRDLLAAGRLPPKMTSPSGDDDDGVGGGGGGGSKSIVAMLIHYWHGQLGAARQRGLYDDAKVLAEALEHLRSHMRDELSSENERATLANLTFEILTDMISRRKFYEGLQSHFRGTRQLKREIYAYLSDLRTRQKHLEEYLHSLRYGQSEQQNRRVVAMEARSTLRKVTCLGVPCCVYGRLTDPMLVSSVNRYVVVGEKPVSGNLCCSVVVVVCCALHAY
jgi:hypothetical protein